MGDVGPARSPATAGALAVPRRYVRSARASAAALAIVYLATAAGCIGTIYGLDATVSPFVPGAKPHAAGRYDYPRIPNLLVVPLNLAATATSSVVPTTVILTRSYCVPDEDEGSRNQRDHFARMDFLWWSIHESEGLLSWTVGRNDPDRFAPCPPCHEASPGPVVGEPLADR